VGIHVFPRAEMPQSEQQKSRPRLDRSKIRIRAHSTPEVGTAEIPAPETPAGLIILPVTVPLSASGDGLRAVAASLQDRGFATFLAELLSPAEVEHGYHNLDFEMLADRIAEVTERLRRKAPFEELPVGYFGTSTDAAAMAIAAAQPNSPAGALVMCDARPELASVELPRVHAPTLFVVEDDELALDLNRRALAKLGCRGDLTVLRGIGKSPGSPETASRAARLAGDWFERHLCGERAH
jgi:putative phosphoribosyl transferase